MASNKLGTLKEDFDNVVRQCSTIPKCHFQGFELGEHFCLFMVKKDLVEKSFKLHFTEDYPVSSLLTIQDKTQGKDPSSDVKQINERLPELLTKIAQDLSVDMQFCVEASQQEDLQSSSMSSDGIMQVDVETEGDDNNNSEPEPGLVQRAMSSDYSYNSDDNWSDDCDNYYNYDSDLDGDMVQSQELNTLLEQDMSNLTTLYGEEALTYRSFSSIDDIDVELHLPLDFFDEEIARAWKMTRKEPLIIRLHLSRSCYLDAAPPKVEIFQPSHKETKEKFGVGQQMTKILEQFLSDHWKKQSNDSVRKQSKCVKTSSQPPRKKRYQSQLSVGSTSSDGKNKPEKTSPTSQTTSQMVVNDRSLAELINMGFKAEEARNSLIISRGSMEEAVHMLVSNPESCKQLPTDVFHADAAHSTSSTALPSKVKGASKKAALGRQHSNPATASGSTSSSTDHGFTKSFNNFISSLIPGSFKPSKHPTDIPDLEFGFLVQIMRYSRQRLPTLNEYCVICDKRHLFQNGAMLKPAVCGGELCVFSFQTLGVMSDAAEDIATGAEVVDLLVNMAKTACMSTRRDTIFDPYPTVIDPDKPTELAFCPKKKDYNSVDKCLNTFLNTSEMTSLDASGLKKAMDKKNNLAYPLLQWIINSNRSHIVKLPTHKQVSFMHTEHQFLLMSSPPAKEAKFREAKAQHGSIFAFHGSHIENWHSILRSGLINASGTKLQMHGAAYGKGIYLSPKAHVSFGYSGFSRHNAAATSRPPSDSKTKPSDRFIQSKNLTCIALCEVVSTSELKKNGDVWVCPEPDHVSTRFFFVYEHGMSADSGIDTMLEKYKKEIHSAMEFSYR